MKKVIMLIGVCIFLMIPVSAMEITPPTVPEAGELYMPEDTQSFGEGLWFVICSGIEAFLPEIAEASHICVTVIAIMIVCSVVDAFPGKTGSVIHIVSTIMLGLLLLQPSKSYITLAADTISQISQYSKLLIPVLTGALAAQGGVTSSTALYAITTAFITLLMTVIQKILIPMVYVYLCVIIINSAVGDAWLLNLRNFIKWLVVWCLKTILYLFTGFISITGVVSGSADASAVKAFRLTVSGMIPVVGGIISEASETVLVSAGVMKSAAGVYGILAIFAVVIGPFLKIAAQYLFLKLSAAVCAIFSQKKGTELIKDFAGGMGIVLGMTGAVCLMLLIGIVCIMKGVS